MKTKQAEPMTPGVACNMHAYCLYRDILQHRPLTLQNWVLAGNYWTLQTESV